MTNHFLFGSDPETAGTSIFPGSGPGLPGAFVSPRPEDSASRGARSFLSRAEEAAVGVGGQEVPMRRIGPMAYSGFMLV